MKNKLLQFFTGKMSRTIYISVVSAIICGIVMIISAVIVHNNNQKTDAVMESLSTEESVMHSENIPESTIESITGSALDMANTESSTQMQSTNNRQAEDNQKQYEEEYMRLEKEYHEKQRELQVEYENNLPLNKRKPACFYVSEEQQAQYLKELESENQRIEMENVQREKNLKSITEQMNALDAQYEKDVAALKAKYGIA